MEQAEQAAVQQVIGIMLRVFLLHLTQVVVVVEVVTDIMVVMAVQAQLSSHTLAHKYLTVV